MRFWFCHVTGGIHNYNFHGYLSKIAIENYRNQGCKVRLVEVLGRLNTESEVKK